MVIEREHGATHVPRYRKGCRGGHHPACWLCKVRHTIRYLNQLRRLRRSHKRE